MSSDTPRLLTAHEVSQWLRLPVGRVRRLARSGVIPSMRLVGDEMRFDADTLMEWLEESQAATSPA